MEQITQNSGISCRASQKNELLAVTKREMREEKREGVSLPSLFQGRTVDTFYTSILTGLGKLLPTPSPPCGCRKHLVLLEIYVPKRQARGDVVCQQGPVQCKRVCISPRTEFRQEGWGRPCPWGEELEPLHTPNRLCLSAVWPKRRKSQGRLWVLPGWRQQASQAPPPGLQGPLPQEGRGTDLSVSRGAVLLVSHCQCPGLFLPFVRTFFPLVLVQRRPSLLNHFILFQSRSREENHDIQSTGETCQVAPYLVAGGMDSSGGKSLPVGTGS